MVAAAMSSGVSGNWALEKNQIIDNVNINSKAFLKVGITSPINATRLYEMGLNCEHAM